MKVLVVGGGGREHALVWKAAQSRLVDQVFVAPGNAGTGSEPKAINVPIDASDVDGLLQFAREEQIGLTIVGPEAPLVSGIADRFEAAGLPCFGPGSKAAMLEGSKSFAKAFLQRHQIPTARYQSFSNLADANRYLEQQSFPTVIKADGLAAGKGVVIAATLDQARETVSDMLSGNRFGQAGHRVVVEEFMEGEEASFICMVSGDAVLPMASSQDHKAAGDGDTGPNTGGMGAYSPAPIVDQLMSDKIMEKVIRPTVDGLKKEGIAYLGFLYAGLMIGNDGEPRVVEFNCRFGDPEAQPVLTRLQSDLVAHCLAAVNGELDQQKAEWDPRCCLGVVMAADGYPDSYEKGHKISGLAQRFPETNVFHAGTTLDNEEVLTSGGRVLCVTALGDSVTAAQKLAYEQVDRISWRGAWYRTDIGYRAVAREQASV